MATNGRRLHIGLIKESFTKDGRKMTTGEFAKNARIIEQHGERNYWTKKREAAERARDEVERPFVEQMMSDAIKIIKQESKKEQGMDSSKLADEAIFETLFKGGSKEALTEEEKNLISKMDKRNRDSEELRLKMEMLRMKRVKLEDARKEERDNAVEMLEETVKTTDMSIPEYKARLSRVYGEYLTDIAEIRKITKKEVFERKGR